MTETEIETLRKHIWEQSKVIESLNLGIGGPSSDEQTSMLQKQIADQDHIISTLRCAVIPSLFLAY